MPNILLVEDDKVGADATRLFLELSGHDVAEASSAEEALLLASERRFDLVITDLSLPGAPGDDLPRRLGALGLRAPVIALSGRAPHEEEGTFAAYLRKPCRPNQLLDTIARVTPER